MKREPSSNSWREDRGKTFLCIFFMLVFLFPRFAWTFDEVLPRTGKISLVQVYQYLPTPLGSMPVTRIYDADQGPGILGPGWLLDLSSRILKSDNNLILVSNSTGPVLLFEKEKGKLLKESS